MRVKASWRQRDCIERFRTYPGTAPPVIGRKLCATVVQRSRGGAGRTVSQFRPGPPHAHCRRHRAVGPPVRSRS